jgi:hypothetical protein
MTVTSKSFAEDLPVRDERAFRERTRSLEAARLTKAAFKTVVDSSSKKLA